MTETVQEICDKMSKWRADARDKAIYQLLCEQDDWPVTIYVWSEVPETDPKELKIREYASTTPPASTMHTVLTFSEDDAKQFIKQYRRDHEG